MKKIIISIISFNSSNETIACLESLQKVEHDGLEIETVVVDNDMDHPLVLPDRLMNPHLHLLPSLVNLGFSGGHNKAIEYGMQFNPDYFLVLNNDTLLDKHFLKELVDAAKGENVGMVSPKIYFAAGSEYHKNRYTKPDLGKVFWYAGGVMDWQNILASHRGVDEVDKGQYDELGETDVATGCCVLIARKVIEKVGYYDTRYFLYYEDNDLSQRAKKAGFVIIYQPKSVIWHINAASTGGSGSQLQDYYITRNRLLFAMRYAPLRSKIAILRESINLLRTGREWQKRGVKDFYLRRFGKGSYQR